MTRLLEDAIAEIRKRPAAEQDLAAEVLMEFVRSRDENYQLTPAQIAEVADTLRQIENGTMTFATEEEVAAMWPRFEA
ncbi:hypothetical protein [Xanthobacter sediminis]